jgi:hypothetical protein
MAIEKNFVLVGIGLGQNKIVYGPASIVSVQVEKKRLSTLPQWRSYIFQVRTPAGYAAVKVYDAKKKRKN